MAAVSEGACRAREWPHASGLSRRTRLRIQTTTAFFAPFNFLTVSFHLVHTCKPQPAPGGLVSEQSRQPWGTRLGGCRLGRPVLYEFEINRLVIDGGAPGIAGWRPTLNLFWTSIANLGRPAFSAIRNPYQLLCHADRKGVAAMRAHSAVLVRTNEANASVRFLRAEPPDNRQQAHIGDPANAGGGCGRTRRGRLAGAPGCQGRGRHHRMRWRQQHGVPALHREA